MSDWRWISGIFEVGLTDGHTDGHTDGQTLLQRCEDASKNNHFIFFQIPFVLRPPYQICGEVLLGLYYHYFGAEVPYNIPAYTEDMIIQETPFPVESHFLQEIEFEASKAST